MPDLVSEQSLEEPTGVWPLRPEFVTSERRVWSDLVAVARILRQRGPFSETITMDAPHLYFVLESVGGALLVTDAAHFGARPPKRLIQHLSLVPAAVPIRRSATHVGLVRDLTLEVSAAKVREATEATIDPDRFYTRLMFADREALRIGELLAAECRPERPNDTLYADCLCMALFHWLVRQSPEGAPAALRGGLASWQLNRVIDRLQAGIADSVSLAELAGLTGLSQSYFIRAFKASTGRTPHQWLREARIQRARELLVDRRLPLAQVALQTGFSDQAHLTRIFHELTGESPGAWRRSRLAPPGVSRAYRCSLTPS